MKIGFGIAAEWLFGFKILTHGNTVYFRLFRLVLSVTINRELPTAAYGLCSNKIGFFYCNEAKDGRSVSWDLIDILFGHIEHINQFPSDARLYQTSVVCEGKPYSVFYRHGQSARKRPRSPWSTHKRNCTEIECSLLGDDPINPLGHLTESEVISRVHGMRKAQANLKEHLANLRS